MEENQDESFDVPESVELPINGELDLHTFRPAEVKELLPEYLHACMAKGIFTVRVVHGKGTGALRESVHAILRRMPEVESCELAGGVYGRGGATMVHLKVPGGGG